MIIMCPFFDDVKNLTNFQYTWPCVTRIGKTFMYIFGLLCLLISLIRYYRYLFILFRCLLFFRACFICSNYLFNVTFQIYPYIFTHIFTLFSTCVSYIFYIYFTHILSTYFAHLFFQRYLVFLPY